jgi:hypothetical protein
MKTFFESFEKTAISFGMIERAARNRVAKAQKLGLKLPAEAAAYASKKPPKLPDFMTSGRAGSWKDSSKDAANHLALQGLIPKDQVESLLPTLRRSAIDSLAVVNRETKKAKFT